MVFTIDSWGILPWGVFFVCGLWRLKVGEIAQPLPNWKEREREKRKNQKLECAAQRGKNSEAFPSMHTEDLKFLFQVCHSLYSFLSSDDRHVAIILTVKGDLDYGAGPMVVFFLME
jgi:hypothetical protein